MKITPSLDPNRLPYMLSTKQAAEWLNMSEATLRYQMRIGNIRAHKVGSQWRIVRNDLCGKMEVTQ